MVETLNDPLRLGGRFFAPAREVRFYEGLKGKIGIELTGHAPGI